MDAELFNLLSGLGGGGSIAAVFLYLWRESRTELKDARTLYEARCERLQTRIDELQDKRLSEALTLRLLVEASNSRDDALLAAFNRSAA